MQTITLIGNGNMGLSIAEGLKGRYTIEVVGRNMDKLDAFEKALDLNIDKYLLNDFDITDKTVLFCVKPANVEEVAAKLKGTARVVYSVLAGTSLKKLKANLNTHAVVRAMPNLGASVGRSMTTITGDVNYKEDAHTLLGAIGGTLWMDSEKEIDIATALAGSGPAYLALVAEALADGAAKQGLKREHAMAVMRGLFSGFGELIQEVHPSLLKDGVMSPGEQLLQVYAALEDGNVRAACINAIEEAYKKAKEL